MRPLRGCHFHKQHRCHDLSAVCGRNVECRFGTGRWLRCLLSGIRTEERGKHSLYEMQCRQIRPRSRPARVYDLRGRKIQCACDQQFVAHSLSGLPRRHLQPAWIGPVPSATERHDGSERARHWCSKGLFHHALGTSRKHISCKTCHNRRCSLQHVQVIGRGQPRKTRKSPTSRHGPRLSVESSRPMLRRRCERLLCVPGCC